jgi:ketosteroid isomerase-like protein
MRIITAFVIVTALVLFVPLTGCQQPKPQPAAGLTAEEVAAIGKTIDTANEAYAAKNLDGVMQLYAADAIELEYDKRYQGVDDIRDKHIKPEFAEITNITFKAADRIVRGHSGLAYVSERNIFEGQDKKGDTYSTDSAWASYVLEKQPDGAWKCKQMHWSGPMNWLPKKAEKAPAKK